MNKKKLIEMIHAFVIAQNDISHLESDLSNITTNLQNAQEKDIVFYKLNPDQKSSIENFEKRIKEFTPGLLILNVESQKIVNNKNVLFIDSKIFLNAQKILLDHMFPNKLIMKMVGVTGTNGKTTTVNLAMQISTLVGHPALSIGTIGVQDSSGALISDIESTTPSYVELRKLIYLYQDKYQVCFMEVSSHALAQNRLFDIELSAAAWTSFSQDHLDYHRTMEDYFNAKLLIVDNNLEKNKSLILPSQEENLIKLIQKKLPKDKYKIAKSLDERGFGRSIEERPLFYHSTYNQSNAELALELNAELFGSEKLKSIRLKDIKTPMGRFSIIELGNENLAIIDYAHTPDALSNIGAAIKNAFPKHKLTVVFGCGGNRDKTKRPLMGKAVSAFADKIIVTSDNPRDEAPEDIILDTIAGIKTSFEAVVDREKAIWAALDDMIENEIVLIAGKGHEEYQEIKGVKYPFSDFNIVKRYEEEALIYED